MVRGYLETCYHFFQLEDWEKADRVLMIRVAGLTDEDLDDALGTWGAYSEQINLYQKLLGKLNHTRNISLLNGLGNACDTIGQFQTAIDYYHTALEPFPISVVPTVALGITRLPLLSWIEH
jgi:tetratricopeptide (TPR) repeat protein